MTVAELVEALEALRQPEAELAVRLRVNMQQAADESERTVLEFRVTGVRSTHPRVVVLEVGS